MELNSRKVFISLIHFPVYTLGPGKRAVIWFEGCNLGCKSCISEYTWKKKNQIYINDIINELLNYNDIQGITISGGEPFQQPDELNTLLSLIRNHFSTDILVYSGYKYSYLKKKFTNILKKIDIIIDGRFIIEKNTDYIWKGSDNQEMKIITKDKRIIEKYLDYSNQKAKRSLQITEKNNKIYIIGIPESKDTNIILNEIIK